MNILIIGCGQLGSQLANLLDAQNHDIAIIGPKQNLINNLNENFSGILVPGNQLDVETIKSAGVENCDCTICVTESDNKNIMLAQLIKSKFNLSNIIVRILDPIKCEIYSQMGYNTISPTVLAFESIYAKIFEINVPKYVDLGKSTMKIKTVPFEKWMKNKTFLDVEYLNSSKLLGFLNENDELNLFSNENNREIQKSDRLIYVSMN